MSPLVLSELNLLLRRITPVLPSAVVPTALSMGTFVPLMKLHTLLTAMQLHGAMKSNELELTASAMFSLPVWCRPVQACRSLCLIMALLGNPVPVLDLLGGQAVH